ncbi:MAG: S46 family peptidase [Planctomycetia bacterium]|nr:S46 family peptidase [Planctomycetia bacterium]
MTSTTLLHSDEGMWLYNNPPLKVLKERYNFEPTKEWLDHLRMSSVRFNSGGSGSFVSANGLVLTNHHVGADTLQKISTKEKDYLNIGYYAKTAAEEIPAKDLELNVLLSITDVTDKVNAAVKEGMSAADAGLARRKAMTEIEAKALEGKDDKKFRADVVTLYNGGAYHLYQFKKYTDVRLVFAPEKDIAFFGGDPDNFEYPRYDLDVCFFRAYEDGKPAQPEHYLKWSETGTKEGDLTFVSGHPGRTSRGLTMAHLEYIRDKLAPYQLNWLRRLEVMLKTYSDRSKSNAQEAQDDLFGIQNSRKARLGGLAGLQDPALMGRKAKEEADLRESVAKDPKLKDYQTAWAEVETTLKYAREYFIDYNLWERGQAFNSHLFGKARTLLRAADERAKPDGERLREFRQSGLKSLEMDLFSEAPIHENLEIVELADSLGMMVELAGVDHPLVKKILAGKSPRDRAAELVRGSKLNQVSERKKLYEGGKDAVAASSDPMIGVAKIVDEEARRIRKQFEENVEEPQRQAYAKIAKARFAVQGTGVYPDATFTLRLSFGPIKGFEENGQQIAPYTTLGGAFERSKAQGGQDPFKLPDSWHKAKDKMKLDTPFNFVSTADIIGGNSGSPVVDRKGEFVGIIFDGNIQSLVLDYAYSDVIARAVSVDCRGIMESLKSVYGTTDLVNELLKK